MCVGKWGVGGGSGAHHVVLRSRADRHSRSETYKREVGAVGGSSGGNTAWCGLTDAIRHQYCYPQVFLFPVPTVSLQTSPSLPFPFPSPPLPANSASSRHHALIYSSSALLAPHQPMLPFLLLPCRSFRQ